MCVEGGREGGGLNYTENIVKATDQQKTESESRIVQIRGKTKAVGIVNEY